MENAALPDKNVEVTSACAWTEAIHATEYVAKAASDAQEIPVAKKIKYTSIRVIKKAVAPMIFVAENAVPPARIAREVPVVRRKVSTQAAQNVVLPGRRATLPGTVANAKTDTRTGGV
jgi:hypothetical protein